MSLRLRSARPRAGGPRIGGPRVGPPLVFLTTLYVLAFAADLVAPYDPAEQDRRMPFAPPTRLHFVDQDGRFHLRPFVYARVPAAGSSGEYVEDRSRRFPLSLLSSQQPADGGRRTRWRLVGVAPPARLNLLGTDGLGRDLFSRLLHGARISLVAGLAAALLSVGLGVVVGTLAGFYRGWLDEILMRFAELFLALPSLYLLIAVRAFLPLAIGPAEAFLLLVAVIGLVGWPQNARLVRGVVLGTRERDYVLAARGFGASDGYLLWHHLLPATSTVALTQLALLTPRYVLAEVTLSFLGLGVGEPTPSWGTLLASLQQVHVLLSYHWMLSPAVMLVVIVLGYHRLADALQRRWNTPAV